MKKLLFIVGKTSSGKDTISRIISKHLDIPFIVSYTTRPIRPTETDGVEHYFIDDAKMDELEQSCNLIAWTKNDETGIRYCATTDSMKRNIAIYIINPEGIKWFSENSNNGIEYKTIYVDLDEDTIKSRALNRGDDSEVLKKRLSSERDEFDAFKASGNYDYLFNNNCCYDEMLHKVHSLVTKGGMLYKFTYNV